MPLILIFTQIHLTSTQNTIPKYVFQYYPDHSDCFQLVPPREYFDFVSAILVLYS